MAFFTEVAVEPRQGLVTHNYTLWTMGSCFADEIGKQLEDRLFNIRCNPCGTLYNPLSIARTLHRIASGATYCEADLFQHNSLWHSPDFHSRFSAPTPGEVLSKINTAITTLHAELSSLNLLMITLGSARAFISNDSRLPVANCHKLPASHFTVRDVSVAETVDTLSAALQVLQQANPNLQVLLTVSPIRHKAYGYHADRLSKATLLLAVEQLCRDFDAIYFPAYEIMNDELRDYRFYAADMIHPSTVAVEHIFRKFANAYFTPETATLANDALRLTTRMQHRVLNSADAAGGAFADATTAMARTLTATHPELTVALGRFEATTSNGTMHHCMVPGN